MKVVCQRVKEAMVRVNNEIVGSINEGLLILVGFNKEDTIKNIEEMSKKIVNLRVFNDDNGVMNLSLLDKDYSILSVSQFTLYADTKKGNRPSYINAMNGDNAKLLYEKFNEELKKYTKKVETGIFRADMKVSLINDGPVTIILEK
ncbi:MAG TPA: D-aminoacyl-tRNA deacylase [Clostridiaceae bacterium]|nr:D-aminoacyl-tRNA deacylase [Clostridiaceae bacterium]